MARIPAAEGAQVVSGTGVDNTKSKLFDLDQSNVVAQTVVLPFG